MKKNADKGYEKTKPKQTQSNPISKAKKCQIQDNSTIKSGKGQRDFRFTISN